MFNWFFNSSKSRSKPQSAGARRRLPAAGGATAARLPLLPARRGEGKAAAALPEWARELHPQAQRVVATLPASVGLARSCVQYPQAVETILANWSHPRDF